MARFPITQRAEAAPAPPRPGIVYEATVPLYDQDQPYKLTCTIYGTTRYVSVATDGPPFQVASSNLAGVALLDAAIREVLDEFLAGVDQLEADAKAADHLEHAK